MFVLMFVCNLLLPLIMVIAGYFMYKHSPKDINGIIGYRTKLSMKNQETWDFAQKFCGKLWLKIGGIMLLLSLKHNMLAYCNTWNCTSYYINCKYCYSRKNTEKYFWQGRQQAEKIKLVSTNSNIINRDTPHKLWYNKTNHTFYMRLKLWIIL